MNPRAHSLVRCTATLLVVLWSLQPVGDLLHLRDAHAHRFCPEHQTFEETAKGTSSIQERLSPRRTVQVSALPASGTDPVKSTHEKCPLLTSSAREPLAFGAPVSWALEWRVESHAATAPPLVRPPLSVLDTAPKASPPARA